MSAMSGTSGMSAKKFSASRSHAFTRSHTLTIFFFKKIVAREKIKSYLVATSRMASLLPAKEKKVSDEHHR
jgi:hypothetical protein